MVWSSIQKEVFFLFSAKLGRRWEKNGEDCRRLKKNAQEIREERNQTQPTKTKPKPTPSSPHFLVFFFSFNFQLSLSLIFLSLLALRLGVRLMSSFEDFEVHVGGFSFGLHGEMEGRHVFSFEILKGEG